VDVLIIFFNYNELYKSPVQAQNGSFPETGSMTYKLVQENSLSTTAYVILAFYDNKQL
jgi:hypothetical protein